MDIKEEVAFWPLIKQAEAIRSGEFGSRELLELYIHRHEKINPELNAIVTTNHGNARIEADKADAFLKSGKKPGPLHGIPTTVKDALETEDLLSTGGAVELKNNVPKKDAPVVGSIKEAGAIVFGKTNLPRWSGDIQSYNDIFGTTVNPWNRDRVPGGSSGGAAAAVSAGLTSFEIGTDIGGSIRFPASFCGTFGHKPSFGIVPSTGYIDHTLGGTTEADVNVIGPIARSAEDLELLLKLMLRKNGPLLPSLTSVPEKITSIRIGAWLDDPFCSIDSKPLAVLHKAIENIEAAGISVDQEARPDIDPEEAFSIGMWLVSAAMLQSAHPPDLESANLEPRHRDWLDYHRRREAIRLKWAEFFSRYDAIIMPISPVSPFPHDHSGTFASRTLTSDKGERPYLDLVKWPILTGMAYLPSTTPPIGLDSDGLPVSFQVVGPYGSDFVTIRLARFIAEANRGYTPPLGLD
ncbi:MAG: amidase [Gammaproteobacteria bacterium]|nr:amidase [Gammaproteobacteria bacterium]